MRSTLASLCPLLLGALFLAPVRAESLAELRADVEAAVADGLTGDELRALAARWEVLLAEASAPGEVASLAQVAALLCDAGAPEAVEGLRERALRSLVTGAPRSGRARRLLASAFLPRLERLAPAEQPEAVRRYDALFEALARTSEEPAARAACLYAPIHLRLEVARTWDAAWLDAAERERTDAALGALAKAWGDL